jgi:hypothetical protein
MAVYDQEIVDATPQYLQTKSYSAQKFRNWFADIVQAGVFGDTDFAFSLLSGMNYRMGPGKAYVLGQQVADQGMYRVVSLANADLTIPAAHATLPRLDQIILRVMDNTHDGSGFNEARIETVPGNATSGATLDNRDGAANLASLGEASKNVLLLYDYLIPAAASSLTLGNARRKIDLARIGFGTLPDTIPLLTVAQFQALRNFPDGMEVYVLADASAGVIFHLRYRAAASTHKWEVIGAPALTAEVTNSEALGSAAVWVNLPTAGPSIVIPLAGDYEVDGGARGQVAYLNGGTVLAGLAIGDTTPFDYGQEGATDPNNPSSTIGNWGTPQIPLKRKTFAMNDVLKLRYQTTPVAGSFADRKISARPIRVSQ